MVNLFAFDAAGIVILWNLQCSGDFLGSIADAEELSVRLQL